MMRIVVVDGSTLNPGDLSWKDLEELGKVEIYGRSDRSELLQRCAEADAIITNKAVIDREMMHQLPCLKYIGVTATGYNIIDLEGAEANGITVTNVPVYGTESVAQMVFALLLELTQHVGYHSETVHTGRWAACSNFCYWDRPLVELNGRTMGIIGCGLIGKAVARIANAFGMEVIGYDVVPIDGRKAGIHIVDLDSVFSQSDVISLHCPFTEGLDKLVNSSRIAKMKTSAFLINTSRGQLVDEEALAEALNQSRIAGAAIDVLAEEPPAAKNPLLTAKNCYITPHIAWATRSARERLLNTSIKNLRAFTQGRPENVVVLKNSG